MYRCWFVESLYVIETLPTHKQWAECLIKGHLKRFYLILSQPGLAGFTLTFSALNEPLISAHEKNVHFCFHQPIAT